MKWISEAEKLPPIAQLVLLAVPRQGGDFWDLKTSRLLVRHEDVHPRPVPRGSKWPVEYWWSGAKDGRSETLVTGNAWWTLLNTIPLPPGAEHRSERGQHWVSQPRPVWIGQDQ